MTGHISTHRARCRDVPLDRGNGHYDWKPRNVALALIRPGQLYAWKGPSLLLVDTRGECGEAEQLSGYYFREARFLRTQGLPIAVTLVKPASIDTPFFEKARTTARAARLCAGGRV
jgi:hypothetical protein